MADTNDDTGTLRRRIVELESELAAAKRDGEALGEIRALRKELSEARAAEKEAKAAAQAAEEKKPAPVEEPAPPVEDDGEWWNDWR